MSEYHKLQPGRPILAVFVTAWDLMGQLQRKILEDEKNIALIPEAGALCLFYDSTEEDSLGRQEMKRLGREYFPCWALVDREGCVRLIEESPFTEETIHRFLTQELGEGGC